MKKVIIQGDEMGESFIESEADQAIKDIEGILEIALPFALKIRLHNSRKDYEKCVNKYDTRDWEVGNTNSNNEIDIFNPDIFEKESSHKKEDFPKILKHEIAHVYIRQLAGDRAIPMWLNEGLAMYLSDQVSQYTKKGGFYIESNYASKLSTQFGWDKYADYDAYEFACLFLGYLVKNYSIKKLVQLITSLDRNYYEPHFRIKFERIFNSTLEKLEVCFIDELM